MTVWCWSLKRNGQEQNDPLKWLSAAECHGHGDDSIADLNFVLSRLIEYRVKEIFEAFAEVSA